MDERQRRAIDRLLGEPAKLTRNGTEDTLNGALRAARNLLANPLSQFLMTDSEAEPRYTIAQVFAALMIGVEHMGGIVEGTNQIGSTCRIEVTNVEEADHG